MNAGPRWKMVWLLCQISFKSCRCSWGLGLSQSLSSAFEPWPIFKRKEFSQCSRVWFHICHCCTGSIVSSWAYLPDIAPEGASVSSFLLCPLLADPWGFLNYSGPFPGTNLPWKILPGVIDIPESQGYSNLHHKVAILRGDKNHIFS